MPSQPSLDRFEWQGPDERYGIKVLLLLPECHVCGQEAHPRFLKSWNGQDVCKYCINDIEEETEHELYNHDNR